VPLGLTEYDFNIFVNIVASLILIYPEVQAILLVFILMDVVPIVAGDVYLYCKAQYITSKKYVKGVNVGN